MTELECPSALFDEAEKPKALIIFAHGAGADKSSEFMEHFAQRLTAIQFSVLRFNFPYMDKRLADGKRRPPDRMPKLIECFESVLHSVRELNLPIFLMGKSMGSRVAATMAETELHNVEGVIALGYPFHPQKKPENLRLTPIFESKKPMLIIQGSRDALGNREEITDYDLPEYCQTVFLEDGDHDLKPRVKSGFTHQEHIESAIRAIEGFFNEHVKN